MTIEKAHEKAARLSRRPGLTVFVVCEEQNDGTMYDVATPEDLEGFYQGLTDNNILAAYEDGQREEGGL